MNASRSPLKSCDIMTLAVVPNAIQDTRIRLLNGCTITVDTSNTCQETWQVAVILSDEDDKRLRGVGRVLVHVAHGYGG